MRNFCAVLVVSCISTSLCNYFICLEGRFEFPARVIHMKTISVIPSAPFGEDDDIIYRLFCWVDETGMPAPCYSNEDKYR